MSAKKQKLSQKQKEIIEVAIYRRGASSWPDELKKEYFYKLQIHHKLSIHDIPQNTYTKTLSEILKIIEIYDPELLLFTEYHKKSERYTQKLVELYKLPDLTDVEINSLITTIKEKDYDIGHTDQWKVISIERNTKEITVSVAKNHKAKIPVRLDEGDLDSAVWAKLAKIAANKVRGEEHMIECSVRLLVDKRTVITVKFDLIHKTIEYSRDIKELDDSGKLLLPEEMAGEKEQAFNLVADALGIVSSKDNFVSVYQNQNDNIVSEDVFQRLKSLNSDQNIVVHIKERYYKTPASKRLTEDVTANLPQLKKEDALEALKKYYTENKYLRGFFEKHGDFNSKNASTIGSLATDSEAESRGDTSYFFTIRAIKSEEKVPLTYKIGNDKLIEHIKFKLEHGANNVDVLSKYYSEEAYNALLFEIRRLSAE
ncbi:hypothetical protein LEP1GSC034_4178 [Leptospira interrogans str. 2003000735]|uniref:Uncharacterized protein n=1 Tax=Leptospira interrogans str. 2002000626 TaxID=996803 RepID=A0A829CZN4_LEPIR|nr:hypothetical protein [Leptospira interrogans]EMY02085.1 hypothetical protein LEP1GSC029_1183 [Leptospira interrogans str. 2002000626]EKN88191.1 hypothetical protein LEP1GSC027_4836 [Leptospira interrogans str. 2002000624]EKQ36804.1 hypothetical protein LEP1GSC025_4779 [Leptospira interrogans str. 2002000621]EKQ48851.1 hypothetical protein LEP1GSC026_0371 [Leptospira interrogans str. 2002000623]EMJ71814.1 hypothetical protein LEP1GSC033_4105 [Leptospira interrogans str. 2002000632]